MRKRITSELCARIRRLDTLYLAAQAFEDASRMATNHNDGRLLRRRAEYRWRAYQKLVLEYKP